MRKEPLIQKASKVISFLKSHGIKCHYDSSNSSIGKRYSRLDEMGIKFAITIDYETLDNESVTIRERDSMKQIRAPIENIIDTTQKIDLF